MQFCTTIFSSMVSGIISFIVERIFFVNACQKQKHCESSAFVFGNDVCLRQMMLALPMMTAAPNDVCLTAH